MTQVEKHPRWQVRMEASYARWQEGGELHGRDYDGFLEGLGELDAMCVALGNLNYQVENGGFMQWHDNGYSSAAGLLAEALGSVGTLAATQVSTLVEEANETIASFEELKDEYGRAARYSHGHRLADFEADFSDMVQEKLCDELEPLDSRDYDVSGQLSDDIEAWLVRTESQEGGEG